ncbi:MAG: alpha-glucosidase/alpha-galactosidase [Actinobacteria bacterium]|nr:alpha-glucosidase/alpha-galactosidase [Actinomycetota bacterium]
MPKITIIGAGSVEFTKNVLADILSFEELDDVAVALHDIDPQRLETAEAMARYTNDATGGRAKIESHLDRRAALAGTDYAINEIQVGGRDALLVDFAIPKRYGLRQTIADTLGIGGVIRGLRTLPVLVSIGNDMADVCPNGWLLNYTNPMAQVPWAVYQGSRFSRVVGLCHSVRDTESFLASTVGVPKGEIAYRTAGLNHQAFVVRFERNGENLYPLLDEAISRDPEGLGRRVRVEIYRRFGYFPTESSEHSAEYVPWFMRHDEMIERFRIPVDDYIGRTAEALEEYREIERKLRAGEDFDIEPTSELASEVIHAIETGIPRRIYGNVRNGGLIEGYPPDCTVEVPCLVDKAGVQPTRVGRLPPQITALNRTYLNVAELTVRAVLEEDRRHVYHAAMLDPNAAATLTLDRIHDLVDELIEAHGDLIPEAIRRGSRRSSPTSP